MKAITDIRIKRREALIKELKKENEELRRQIISQADLREQKQELDEQLFQIEELRNKLNNDIKEFEEAKDAYLIEKQKFVRLNLEYKRKMEKFFKQIKIPEQEEL